MTIELVNALQQEKVKGKAGQIVEGMNALELVILDELGYLPFSASGGAWLFHLLSKLCQDDHRFGRPPDRQYPNFGDWQRQLGLQGMLSRRCPKLSRTQAMP